MPKQRDGFRVKASRWFNERYKIKCGIVAGPGAKKDFHSFRHTFADHLKQKQVDPYMIAELLGHSVDSITVGRYGKRYGVKILLNKAVVKVDYGIDLSVLKGFDHDKGCKGHRIKSPFDSNLEAPDHQS